MSRLSDSTSYSFSGDDAQWIKSHSTQLCLEDFNGSALVAFTHKVDWERFLTGDHDYHCELIRQCSEIADKALDLIRFYFCRLNLPETLPGQAGTFEDNSFSGGIFYNLQDNESYLTGGQVVTHKLVTGIGLQIDGNPEFLCPYTGETGMIARHALSLYSQVMNQSNLTSKFVDCMRLLDFLAYPYEYKEMAKVKKEIAAHVTNDQESFNQFTDSFRQYVHYKDLTGQQKGLRTLIVHHGKRLEDITSKQERSDIFERLESMIFKTISDLIRFSDEPWDSVRKYRNSRKY